MLFALCLFFCCCVVDELDFCDILYCTVFDFKLLLKVIFKNKIYISKEKHINWFGNYSDTCIEEG